MTKKKMLSFNVVEEVYHRLKQYAFEQHQSMSSIITRWIMEAPVKNEDDYKQSELPAKEK